MLGDLDFGRPFVLLLLPLALLPLLPRRRDTLGFSHLALLPEDPVGRIAGQLWRACAVLALASILIALAGPGRVEQLVTRSGTGAEIMLLMDRSRSMAEPMLLSNWRDIDPIILPAQTRSRGKRKGAVARNLLSTFVRERPDDRFALMFFSEEPIRVVGFTDRDDVVQAGIAAGGVGRGLSNTHVGSALEAAIEAFDDRPYSGSRIILLVSDGGSHLDEATRERIRAGLERNRITLNWLYLRTFNGPDFDDPERYDESVPAIGLHRWFGTLDTPYRAYQSETPEDLADAVADIGRAQNFPLDHQVQVPRVDLARPVLAVATVFCGALLALALLQLRRWT